MQGTTFQSSPQVLALKCFDLILGEDWLEEVSPIWVDYRNKVMKVTYKEKRVTLKGVQDTQYNSSPIPPAKLKGLLKNGMISHCISFQPCHESNQENAEICGLQTTEIDCPNQIKELLVEYDHLFATPTSEPPHRSADHFIPLVPGAQPVKVRPYKYSPVQKDEIDRQLQEMLDNGIIRTSTSPFASPVLLVKKKDNSWRFCIDYRQLNSITVKNKHPMPIVEELLDELAGAAWFTNLDFRSGYHQVCMA